MSTGEDFYFHIPVCENRTELYLDDICILHNDLITFLELFSVIDKSYDQVEDINRLTSKLKEQESIIIEKDKKITELKSLSEKTLNPKTENSYLNIIAALLETTLENNVFGSQNKLIEHLSSNYQGYIGLSEANLRKQFAAAKQSLKNL
ncbi:hypothetical protein FHQ30_03540 [Pasteurellaceae bacterium Phil11]|nr:hypothetical protein FHQ30_03540 [Pasteurellaceae bacterium Phil11]